MARMRCSIHGIHITLGGYKPRPLVPIYVFIVGIKITTEQKIRDKRNGKLIKLVHAKFRNTLYHDNEIMK